MEQAGLRVSVSELARIKGVSQPAISKRLKRLVGEGLIEARKSGREITVSLAEWDTVTNEATDPARLVARDTRREIEGDRRLEDDVARRSAAAAVEADGKDPSYTQQLTRKAGLEADLKAIELAKQKGELLRIEDARKAMEACAEAIVRDLGQLPTYADDVAAAVGKAGAAGARDALKVIERRIRETLARSMTLLAGDTDDAAEAA